MSSRPSPLILLVLLALIATAAGAADDAPANQNRKPIPDGSPVDKEKGKRAYHTESVRGKVVWLGEALNEYFDITTVPESYQRTLAIYTDRGQLLPLAEDLRGRSFRKDERLRGKSMELFVRRYKDHPILQVIRVYEFQDGKKYEVDYWCDVCAIVMYEKGLCACCQDNNRLRHRFVDEKPKKSTLKR